MAGQPQENPWSQQGQGYPQGVPGYGPAYEQQGQPAPYPPPFEQHPYEPPQAAPAGYEPQPTVYGQPPEYGYPGQPQSHPGQPQPGQPMPGPGQHQSQPQAQSQEQQDWEQWQAVQQQAARQQARGQNRNQGQAPKPSGGGQQGFVSSLFDFSFNSFVTPKIIKALYAVVAAWTILWAIILLFIGNTQWGLTGLLVMLIIVDPLLILLSLGLLRVALEFFMITFRMQEDLKAIREQSGASRPDADTVVGRVSGPDA